MESKIRNFSAVCLRLVKMKDYNPFSKAQRKYNNPNTMGQTLFANLAGMHYQQNDSTLGTLLTRSVYFSS